MFRFTVLISIVGFAVEEVALTGIEWPAVMELLTPEAFEGDIGTCPRTTMTVDPLVVEAPP
jgi:hypothetical protein